MEEDQYAMNMRAVRALERQIENLSHERDRYLQAAFVILHLTLPGMEEPHERN